MNSKESDISDMDSSNSNINEVFYDDQLHSNTQMIQHDENGSFDPYDSTFNYNKPVLANYFQEHNPSKHSPYSFISPHTFYKNPSNHKYRITNDHRGQYVLKRQDVNTNLISTNERYIKKL